VRGPEAKPKKSAEARPASGTEDRTRP